LLVIIIGARDHWQRTSWRSFSIAPDHRSSRSLTERKTVKKSRWWCHEIGAHFSLSLSLLFWCVDFPSRFLRVFWDNFSPHCSCTFCVNLGQDWLRARFRHMFVLATMAAEFSWVSSSGRCTWRRISLPGGERLIGLPTKKKQYEGWSKERFE
jgi:hypothetical protein